LNQGFDRAAIERLYLGRSIASPNSPFALCLDPQAVIIATVPALGVPGVTVAAINGAVLQPVEQHHVACEAAVLGDQLLLALGGHQLRVPHSVGRVLGPEKAACEGGATGGAAPTTPAFGAQ
jgi:hypothetical protein